MTRMGLGRARLTRAKVTPGHVEVQADGGGSGSLLLHGAASDTARSRWPLQRTPQLEVSDATAAAPQAAGGERPHSMSR